MLRDILRTITPYSVERATRDALRHSRRLLLFFQERPSFVCPWCAYTGKFLDEREWYGNRRNARCPRCGALERHRLQHCVLEEVFRELSESLRATSGRAQAPCTST